jgi:hypothetical protein
MSALGQKRTFAVQKVMSALPPKADMCSATRHVRFTPKADKLCCGIFVRYERLRRHFPSELETKPQRSDSQFQARSE